MDSVAINTAYNKHKELVDSYFENDGKKIHKMIDKILFKLKFNVENSDFYSLGNEIFLDVLCRYDGSKDFDGFLYSCLMNKFKTEMTRRNRYKRQADVMSISIDTPIGDKENMTIGDLLVGENTVEKEIFEKNKDYYSQDMAKYLSRLSFLQQEVLYLISIGFTPNEIIGELHINKKQYDDCYNAIHSYKNISVLM